MVRTEKNIIHAVIVAAGSGSRYGSDLPKQFLPLCGEPVLCHSIRTFRRTFPHCCITIVLSEWGENYWRDYCARTGFECGRIVPGGATRSESVRNAVSCLDDPEDSLVMVHDGARPLISAALLEALARAAGNNRGSVPALPMTDSMIEVSDRNMISPAERSHYRTVQTPQVFPLSALRKVYNPLAHIEGYTDELSAIIAGTDLDVTLVPGQPDNIKITNPGDLELAEFFLKKK